MPVKYPLWWGVPEINVPPPWLRLGRALVLAKNAPFLGHYPLPLQGSLFFFFHSFSLFLAGGGSSHYLASGSPHLGCLFIHFLCPFAL